ncbi:3-Hydroxybutyryl-CoA epimerase/3-hydroxyacyl-CoA dehydrogenase/enoyl-CoA hydratase [Acididesulfobacillus acetoxydans]|uniref:3-hydroxybutyryl-CoA dehydrogenase n=1 Tax=Acididesulfobacillus acetoxydans TaxID=1561005 RepID=A0A8S0WY01_9FIRM|nr:3-hydroxyacyl-CoA dehydrogenase family protein [Acididesulfobacillus acetoxydans]CAA7601221.1 3-Hydroxybutyryl-CoA epimerase/3-hydroxyacyl-CoA dehydrogenase/enoyl-CoA hydratase [Acididesulfobacillus acetoxydans]CEJ08500.1 3-hydroxybutyryl-CoA dehydrogenase [Acididesulfobacillus acetoxydans]
MKVEDIKKISVVGAGNMGHQIAISAALAGYQVSVTDISSGMLSQAENFAKKYLPERVTKGKLSQDIAERTLANLKFTLSLEEAVSDADYVIEAAVEQLDVKRKLFTDIDRLAPSHAILATNSSFIVSSKVADATKRPDKVCNMHFFNPALVMKLVEVVQGPHTSDETAQVTVDLAEKMGKTPVWLKKEIYGFLVNRILAAITNEAVFLADMGIATPEEIDTAVTQALGHPMGPFRLMDLTGIDLVYDIGMERYQETRDPKDKPSPLIVEKYVKKEWGKKTGRGFYSYE